jgi:hypothetical protein
LRENLTSSSDGEGLETGRPVSLVPRQSLTRQRDYCELKQELGLGHYEGRNWRGFHHHASLCIAAYGLLMLERLSGIKKNAARLEAPPVPRSFRPRGSRPDAKAHSLVDRHRALPLGSGHRSTPSAMSMLRKTVC